MVKTNYFFIKKIQKTNRLKINNPNNLWRTDEDQILINIAKLMKRNKWRHASSLLNNKTPNQCYLRYKIINPIIKKGRWSLDEDSKLKDLVNLFGKSWKLISKIMKNRSSKQVRNRYEEHLDENLNKKMFTHEEDEKIYKYLIEKDYDRKTIKTFFPNRSLKMLHNRMIYLKKKKPSHYKKFINTKNINSSEKSETILQDKETIDLNNISNFYENINYAQKNPMIYQDNCEDYQLNNMSDSVEIINKESIVVVFQKKKHFEYVLSDENCKNKHIFNIHLFII